MMGTNESEEIQKTKKLLQRLVERRSEFDSKYGMIDMVRLVKDNCQSKAEVKKLISGLEVLSKYSENLLIPADIRPKKWPTISFHNKTFMDKVQPIKGHRKILEWIGYSKEAQGCLVCSSVIRETIAQIYLELKAIQLELNLWVENAHPYPELFRDMLPDPLGAKRSLPTEAAIFPLPPQCRIDLDDISPNDTLTPQNASRLLADRFRRKGRVGEGEEEGISLPPWTTVQRRRRSEDGTTKTTVMNRNRGLAVYDQKMSSASSSSSPTSSTSPSSRVQVRTFSVSSLPAYETDSVAEEALRGSRGRTPPEAGERVQLLNNNKWSCDHCSFHNNHSENCPGERLHICEVCCRTSKVDCVRRAKVIDRKKSMTPIPLQYLRKSFEGTTAGAAVDRQGFDIGRDFEAIMKELGMREKEGNELLRRDRLVQFIGVLHSQLPHPVPEEEIEFLFSRLVPKLDSVGFLEATDWVLSYWEAAQKDLAKALKERGVYRKDFRGQPCMQSVRRTLVRSNGNVQKAVGLFLEKWTVLLEALKVECFIPDLPDLDYSSALFYGGGSIESTKARLITDRYINLVMGPDGSSPREDALDLYRDARLFDPSVNRAIKDGSIPQEKRVRLLMCECDIDVQLASKVVQLIDSSSSPTTTQTNSMSLRNNERLCIVDYLEAIEVSNGIKEASGQLTRVCDICIETKPVRSYLKMLRCSCLVCKQCVKTYFEMRIRGDGIQSLSCPSCQEPKIGDNFADREYFPVLTKLLQNILDEEVLSLLGTKLAEWAVQDEVIRCPWPDCRGAFTLGDENLRRVVVNCPLCKMTLCTNCHSKWERDSHDCDGGDSMKDLIACPKCKQRFHLARGGCLHIKCTQCCHEFCCECKEEFRKSCKRFSKCPGLGMHCHHPRDCFFYIRDMDIADLERLLGNFITTQKSKMGTRDTLSLPVPGFGPRQTFERSASMCQSRVQKMDFDKEEACGENVCNNELGLCSIHYKEHLFRMMRMRRIDPVHVMDEERMINLLRSNDVKFDSREEFGRGGGGYREYLKQRIQQFLPLSRNSVTTCPPELLSRDFDEYHDPSSFGRRDSRRRPSSRELSANLVPRGHSPRLSSGERLDLSLREDESPPSTSPVDDDEGISAPLVSMDVAIQPRDRLLA